MPVKTRFWFFQKVSDFSLLLFDALKYSEIQFRLYIIVSVVYSYVVCFLLICMRVNQQKASPYTQIKFKSWKSWLIWAIWEIFTVLQAITKEIAAIKKCEIAGWQKRSWAHTLFVETIR